MIIWFSLKSTKSKHIGGYIRGQFLFFGPAKEYMWHEECYASTKKITSNLKTKNHVFNVFRQEAWQVVHLQEHRFLITAPPTSKGIKIYLKKVPPDIPSGTYYIYRWAPLLLLLQLYGGGTHNLVKSNGVTCTRRRYHLDYIQQEPIYNFSLDLVEYKL